jgi:Restriction endonuclease fold toxin 7
MGNRPVEGVDPDGRWVWIAAAAVIGGGLNVWQNWDKVGGDPLRALGYFASGAVSGALATTGPLGWAAGGAITSTGNALLGGAKFDLALLGQAAVGAASGLVGGYAGGVSNFAVKGIASPFLNGLLKGAIGGAASGAAGGAVSAGLTGGDIGEAALQGAVTGAIIGGAVGAGSEGIKAYWSGQNPWTGQSYSRHDKYLQGMEWSGVKQNTTKLPGAGKHNTPDEWTMNPNAIGEVKNTQTLSYTSQIMSYENWARMHGYAPLKLYTRPNISFWGMEWYSGGTRLSSPLQNRINQGAIVNQPLKLPHFPTRVSLKGYYIC